MLRVGLIGPGDIGAHLGRLAREIEGVTLAGVAGADPVGRAPMRQRRFHNCEEP